MNAEVVLRVAKGEASEEEELAALTAVPLARANRPEAVGDLRRTGQSTAPT